MKISRSAVTIIAVSCLAFLGQVNAQTVQPQTPEQHAATLAKEVQEQQASLAANQEKIDAKLAAIAEAVRLARIYASRGGR